MTWLHSPKLLCMFAFSVFLFGGIQPRVTYPGFLVNLSVTEAKNVSRYCDVPGEKLWGISVKTRGNEKDVWKSSREPAHKPGLWISSAPSRPWLAFLPIHCVLLSLTPPNSSPQCDPYPGNYTSELAQSYCPCSAPPMAGPVQRHFTSTPAPTSLNARLDYNLWGKAGSLPSFS